LYRCGRSWCCWCNGWHSLGTEMPKGRKCLVLYCILSIGERSICTLLKCRAILFCLWSWVLHWECCLHWTHNIWRINSMEKWAKKSIKYFSKKVRNFPVNIVCMLTRNSQCMNSVLKNFFCCCCCYCLYFHHENWNV
jgi:hypothetical protein